MNQPDIILKCGFQSITYDYTFKNNKGSKLVESKHVHSVTENKQPNGYSFITSYVIRQMSVTLPPYKVTLEVTCIFNSIVLDSLFHIYYLFF